MDKLNRLTRNEEWQVGASYRFTKGGRRKRRPSDAPPEEVTFLGWHHSGRRELVGWAVLQTAGRKSVSGPKSWRGRYVRVGDPVVAVVRT